MKKQKEDRRAERLAKTAADSLFIPEDDEESQAPNDLDAEELGDEFPDDVDPEDLQENMKGWPEQTFLAESKKKNKAKAEQAKAKSNEKRKREPKLATIQAPNARVHKQGGKGSKGKGKQRQGYQQADVGSLMTGNLVSSTDV